MPNIYKACIAGADIKRGAFLRWTPKKRRVVSLPDPLEITRAVTRRAVGQATKDAKKGKPVEVLIHGMLELDSEVQ